ncbi:N-acetylmuramoyl-L-alanine amidase [Peribacillus frigoritolerans]|uniref:N-acetylmuramoyl-L-alanine amidase family protein n=1 Tax=Peribacillus frigoritolerans TaxID=450367 RepID=UPI00207A611E|nr:N-acetylmuramoyl-L-alanine amidase [Peribacillus frigoritolerans]USK78950.1 N-acetylmuramoyl-L-alanine amidase [Peribacillus frigoritolerans]
MKKIYFDEGHGKSKDPGAVGNGLIESDVVLKISKYTENHLRANYTGFEILNTRKDHTFLTLEARAAKANKWKADVFFSFHANSAVSSSATGYEDFIYSKTTSADTENLQNTIHNQVIPVLKKYGIANRGKKRANHSVTRSSTMPAILTETLFVSNQKDAALLKNEQFLKDISAAYSEGLATYLKLKKIKPVSSPQTTPSATPSSKKVYRVIVDGKQVSAYSNYDNIANEVKKHLGRAREVKVVAK